MKKLVAIMLLVAFAALTVVGCTGTQTPTPSDVTSGTSTGTATKTPTSAPTKTPTNPSTNPPTTAPTSNPDPTPVMDPFPYDRTEYDTLRAFFELTDEKGVKNGKKCFENYDPDRINFWGKLQPGESEPFWSDRPWIYWNDYGRLLAIYINNDSGDVKQLTGEFNLNGFDELEAFSMKGFTLESVRIENCKSLKESVYMQCSGEAYMTGDYIEESFHIVSKTHVHYENSGKGSDDMAKHCFTVDLTVDGGGWVWVDLVDNYPYYTVYIFANVSDGHKFIGWYDESGKLVSTKDYMELSSAELPGCAGNFTYTARFE